MTFVHLSEYPGYAVDETGRVKGPSGKILKPRPIPGGYQTVAIYQGGRSTVKTLLIHHLVLMAFVGPRPDGMEGCHGNGDPSDNRLENLRWDTREANIQDRVDSRPLCPNGHEWTGWRKNGTKRTRYCNRCRRDAYREKVSAR